MLSPIQDPIILRYLIGGLVTGLLAIKAYTQLRSSTNHNPMMRYYLATVGFLSLSQLTWGLPVLILGDSPLLRLSTVAGDIFFWLFGFSAYMMFWFMFLKHRLRAYWVAIPYFFYFVFMVGRSVYEAFGSPPEFSTIDGYNYETSAFFDLLTGVALLPLLPAGIGLMRLSLKAQNKTAKIRGLLIGFAYLLAAIGGLLFSFGSSGVSSVLYSAVFVLAVGLLAVSFIAKNKAD